MQSGTALKGLVSSLLRGNGYRAWSTAKPDRGGFAVQPIARKYDPAHTAVVVTHGTEKDSDDTWREKTIFMQEYFNVLRRSGLETAWHENSSVMSPFVEVSATAEQMERIMEGK